MIYVADKVHKHKHKHSHFLSERMNTSITWTDWIINCRLRECSHTCAMWEFLFRYRQWKNFIPSFSLSLSPPVSFRSTLFEYANAIHISSETLNLTKSCSMNCPTRIHVVVHIFWFGLYWCVSYDSSCLRNVCNRLLKCERAYVDASVRVVVAFCCACQSAGDVSSIKR